MTKEPQQTEVPLPRKESRCKSFKNNLNTRRAVLVNVTSIFLNISPSNPPLILAITKESHTNRGGANQTKIQPHPIGLHTELLDKS